jgi:hypothetical protein
MGFGQAGSCRYAGKVFFHFLFYSFSFSIYYFSIPIMPRHLYVRKYIASTCIT